MIVRTAAVGVIQSALNAVEAERQFINDLNVYPVPDGDTGTNMALTVRAVVEELEQSDVTDIPSVAAAVTKGSLMGARGNSGVILSQIVRGICDVWGQANSLDTAVFKQAVVEGQNAAYRAVKTPVEGTMLTVIREMATAAQAVPDSLGLEHLLAAVEEAGRVAVDNTTAQLPALQKAGVVDAGGYGLLVLFRGLSDGIEDLMRGGKLVAGARLAARAAAQATAGAVGGRRSEGQPAVTVEEPSELSEYRYCTSFLITGDVIDREAFEAFLLPIGDSTLVVGDERTVKVHVHVNDPGVVLTEALKHGAIGDIEINDMHAQTRERDQRLASAPAVGEGGAVVVAVVAGAGNQQLFRDLGCHAIVDGGQSMNPSAAQLLDAVQELGVEEVVILPNNGNVILTAEQAAGMSSLHIAVVPSRSIPSGLAAMVAFDPAEDAVGNARLMQDAIVDVRYAEITHAVRDSELDGLEVKQGQAMAIVDGRLVAASDDIESAFGGVLEEFARGGAEYVTVLTALNGWGTTREQLEVLAARVTPDAEVSFHEGGQPLYPILSERRIVTDLLTLENTAIVLDSTCDPADGWLDQPGLYMVPLKVHFGDQMFRDGVDMTYQEFFAKLEQSEILPTTSQPTAGEFVATYEEARKHYEHIFSLHLSGDMSGTVRAAEQAAEQFDNVYVYDLRTVTTALSLGAERLRARLARGCTLEEARTYVEYFRDNSNLLVHAATLEYLRRGGRIGRAASLVGGVFDIKPLIAAVDGTLTGYAKVRGLKKAMAAMQRFVEERSEPDDELYFCIIDAVNDEEPPLIREMIERIRPNAHYTFQGHVAAVVGTHIGPGTAAFAMIVE